MSDPTLCFDQRVLRRQIAAVLGAWGLTPEARDVTTDVMVETDLAGIDSHGIAMLPVYDAKRAAGFVDTGAIPEVVLDAPAYAALDAGGGLGHFAGVTAMRLAIEKARTAGIAMVAVRNSMHFGAAGYYVRLAAAESMIGFATTSTSQRAVMPTNGGEPVLGTNPIAFAAPGEQHEPFVLDMSTSTVAVNKVRAYGYRDKQLPDGWVVDSASAPVNDPDTAVSYFASGAGGGLTALGGDEVHGGHKGYGLGVMVQILSSALTGGDFTPTRPTGTGENVGHFLLAIDPERVRPDGAFGRDVDEVLGTLEQTRPAGDEPVVVAGAPEAAKRAERLATGVPVPLALLDAVAQVASGAGVDFLLDAEHAVRPNP